MGICLCHRVTERIEAWEFWRIGVILSNCLHPIVIPEIFCRESLFLCIRQITLSNFTPTGLSLSSIICALFYKRVECIQPLRYESYKLLTPFDPFRLVLWDFNGKEEFAFNGNLINLIVVETGLRPVSTCIKKTLFRVAE